MEQYSELKIFVRYVLLNIMSMVGLSCYVLADTYFIANGIGAEGLAALNIALPACSVINGVSMMLGIGGATKFAIFKAQGRDEEADTVFSNIVYTGAAVSVIFVIAAVLFSEEFSLLLGADSTTLPMTMAYLKTLLIFAPASFLDNILNSFIKNDGDPKIAMIARLSGCLFNIVFDYIFIYPLQMGLFGAALATGVTPILGLIILSSHFIRKRNSFTFKPGKPEIKFLKMCIPLGIPSLVTEISTGVVIAVFNILILGISGNMGVAAYGIVANISIVVIDIFVGIAQGIQPILSYAYGAGMKNRIKTIFRYGMVLALFIAAGVYLFLSVKTGLVISMFNHDRNAALEVIAEHGIRLYFLAMPFSGINIVMCSYFASIENKIPAQIISLARGIVLIVPVVIIMAKVMGLTGIWLSLPVTEFVTAVCSILYLIKINRRKMKTV